MFKTIEINLHESKANDSMDDHLIGIFGCLTDIQYSDSDVTVLNTSTRHYRNSLNQISRAIQVWRSYEQENHLKMQFILHLGDLIDSKSKNTSEGSINSMHKVLTSLNQMKSELLHVYGNHEFYNFNRSEIVDLPLNTAKKLNPNWTSNANYYAYQIAANLKLICLDFYVFSELGYNDDLGNEMLLKAKAYIQHMKTIHSNYISFNGGLNQQQLDWLTDQLKSCRETNTKAVIAGHLPINNLAADKKYLAWNHDQLRGLIWQFDDVCVMYLSGHYHVGGYDLDEHNIHHLTLPGIVELSPDSSSSFISCLVYEHKLVVNYSF